MSIVWMNANGTTTRESHAVLVMSGPSTRKIKVMSNVWADQYWCLVWNPTTCRQEVVVLGDNFDIQNERGYATVDVSAEIVAEWAAIQKKEQAEKDAIAAIEAEKAAESSARDEVLKIRFGTEVVVVSGRKVPHGTRGKCIGIYDGNFGGKRIGILDEAGGKHYTSMENCQGVLPGCHVDYIPPGGWRAYRDAQPPEALAIIPKKHNRVRRLSDSLEGVVFWVKGTRLGFKVPGSQEAIWADAHEVVILDIKGNVKNPPPTQQEAPPREEQKINPLAHLPTPYCDIRGIMPPLGANPFWTAIDEHGEFIMNLTEAGAASIKALVAAQE